MPEIAVLDASAVIDAASPGEAFDLFTRLQERFASQAPALLAWELGSVVSGRRAPAYGATPARRAKALELMLAGVDLVATDGPSRSRTVALAARHALTFYDASYLELASRANDRILVTQDKALYAAACAAIGAGRAWRLDGIPRLLAIAGD